MFVCFSNHIIAMFICFSKLIMGLFAEVYAQQKSVGRVGIGGAGVNGVSMSVYLYQLFPRL